MTTTLRFLTLALFVSSTFCLTDCKKDKEPEPDKRSQREIWLTTPGWNMQLITQAITTGGVTTTDTGAPASYGFPLCTLDDIKHFNTNRTLTVDEGPLMCQPPASVYTWDFAANETEIVFGSSNRSKIATLTATTLELVDSETFPGGTTIVQTTTYVAK